jgi:hypothetical protein
MLQSLLTPRYPRRYHGRHRMRFTIWFVSTTPRDGVPAAEPHGGLETAA